MIGVFYFSCAPEKPAIEKPTLPESSEYVPIILDFLKSHLLDRCCLTDNCYNINSELIIDPMSCSYATWNKVYFHTFIAQGKNKNTIYALSEPTLEKAIDFDAIKKLRQTKTDISGQINIESICINWVKNNDSPKTVTFSPLIPFKSMNKYEVWMTINAEEGSPEYKFVFKKEEGKLVMLNHTYGVTCNSKLIDELGDHIKF